MPRAAESPWQIEKWQNQQNLKISSEMKILESYDILNVHDQCNVAWYDKLKYDVSDMKLNVLLFNIFDYSINTI